MDMLDIFTIEDRRKSRWLQTLIPCKLCEEPLSDGGVLIDDEWYCESCAHEWVYDNLVREPIMIEAEYR